jgi:hypothetical protein
MMTRNDRTLSNGERRLLLNLISYTIADLTPIPPFTEEKPPEDSAHATKLWKAHLSRHKEDALNHVTAMAFAVDGDPIVMRSGREMTFKDCLLELGLDNAEYIVEQVRQRPEDFGREAGILLRSVETTQDPRFHVESIPMVVPAKIGDSLNMGF